MFDAMMQEETVPLSPGRPVSCFFTDGISETMNEAFDCYGEARLAKVLEQYAHLPFEQLRSFIFADLRAFAGAADQHDDMTMILLRGRERRGGAAGHHRERCVLMASLTVIFRTRSNIEASVVQALLDSHGIESVRSAGPPPGLFPFTVRPMGETRVSVREEEAEEAVRVIESHREQVGGGCVVPLPQQFGRARGAPRLPLPRPRPARARADAQVEGARGPERRRHRQRVARVSRRRRARAWSSPTRCSARFPIHRGAEVEDQGDGRVDDVAGGAGASGSASATT